MENPGTKKNNICIQYSLIIKIQYTYIKIQYTYIKIQYTYIKTQYTYIKHMQLFYDLAKLLKIQYTYTIQYTIYNIQYTIKTQYTYINHMQLFYDLAKLSKKLSLKYLKTAGRYPGIC